MTAARKRKTSPLSRVLLAAAAAAALAWHLHPQLPHLLAAAAYAAVFVPVFSVLLFLSRHMSLRLGRNAGAAETVTGRGPLLARFALATLVFAGPLFFLPEAGAPPQAGLRALIAKSATVVEPAAGSGYAAQDRAALDSLMTEGKAP